ncbi:uncharacterized protein H6S33_006430 [Morchella sextelata]|uniref:uncharacterized protein n=1 Tax=Morchella sextelata TaxID=1174677 RepID=UPI001D0379F8|nr:uncharacterized protein H6S33_006430 [Morchella sextelata]KAH0604762.1 hypothetical protein H6S33_006430 [Morchella sextelata]
MAKKKSSGSSTETAHQFAAAAQWDLEQDYERRPRALKKRTAEKESTRLPIKTPGGAVLQSVLPERADDSEGEGKEEEWAGVQEEEKTQPVIKELEVRSKVSERQRVINAKEELSNAAILLNEDPEENVGLLKRLREISGDKNATIQKLALATQLAIYKDIIPGYRIRPLTEEEQNSKVTKEVKKLRGFEQSLVANYQAYVENLADLSRASRNEHSPNVVAVGKIAVNCACGLISTVPHFNFRSQLLKVIVERVSVKTLDEVFIKCRTTLEDLFRNDDDGAASFEAVQLLAKMLKAKGFMVDESVLNTFLSLRLLSELDVKASLETVENPRKRKKKDRQFRTKKARKSEKERKISEKEMDEADATVSHEEREERQSETLKLVFGTYFRILKERPPGLMGATLEGLAKYAHLINLDFFGDLLVALKELIGAALEDEEEDDDIETSTQRNATREALLCVITAFALLSGQGEGMSIDLTFFTTHLYATLLPLSMSPDLELSTKSLRLPDPNDATPPSKRINVSTEIEMLIRALNTIFFQQNANKSNTPIRIAAFTKRLMTSSLNMPEKSALATLGMLNKMARKHQRRLHGLFSTEERVGDGTYKMDIDEPEISNPYAATIWETVLLRKHYSPKISEAAKELPKLFKNNRS